MRKIEREMITAIQNKKNWKKDNTLVEVEKDEPSIFIFLFGNCIARFGYESLTIYDGNHQTKTTKSRLNAILSTYNLPLIYQKNYQWYIGEEEWTGKKYFNLREI